MCYNTNCQAKEHPQKITGSILPNQEYFKLLGSVLLHPFPLLSYKTFSQYSIDKLSLLVMIPEEAANMSFLCNTTLQEDSEHEVGNLLCFETSLTKIPAIHRGTSPPPRSSNNSNLLSQSNPPPSYPEKSSKAHLHPKTIITPKCTHVRISRDFQMRLQLSKQIIEYPPNETQYWIIRLCSNMVVITLKSVATE